MGPQRKSLWDPQASIGQLPIRHWGWLHLPPRMSCQFSYCLQKECHLYNVRAGETSESQPHKTPAGKTGESGLAHGTTPGQGQSVQIDLAKPIHHDYSSLLFKLMKVESNDLVILNSPAELIQSLFGTLQSPTLHMHTLHRHLQMQ